MDWFWYFMVYSFLGYLLERMFAKVTRAAQQVRKCFLLLPLCPVYGLGMVVFLALTDAAAYPWWALALQGGILTTGVEFLVHLLYEKVFHVHFWDYSETPGNLRGRVCIPFSLIWSGLSAWAAVYLHPVVASLVEPIPPGVTFAVLLVLAADAVISGNILLRHRDTELLSIRAVARRLAERAEG